MVQNLDNEVWKPIQEFEGFYEISNFGRVKTLERIFYGGVVPAKIYERIRKLWVTPKGYLILSLYRDGKRLSISVHRLVAIHFISNPQNKPQINHKNGVKNDNRVENLEWMTNQENVQHSYDVLKREPRKVAGVDSALCKKVKCDTLDIVFYSLKEAAEKLNVNSARICEICKGLRIHSRGLTFRYI